MEISVWTRHRYFVVAWRRPTSQWIPPRWSFTLKLLQGWLDHLQFDGCLLQFIVHGPFTVIINIFHNVIGNTTKLQKWRSVLFVLRLRPVLIITRIGVVEAVRHWPSIRSRINLLILVGLLHERVGGRLVHLWRPHHKTILHILGLSVSLSWRCWVHYVFAVLWALIVKSVVSNWILW